jgi:hypothetical protein
LIGTIRTLSQQIWPELKIAIRLGFDDCKISIGAKRQQMLQAAEGRYVSFVDDDDMVTAAYIEDAVSCIRGGFDCMRLRGQISQYTFTHSIVTKITDPMANDTTFLRPPNHLNVMKTDIAKTISFINASSGEDTEWAIKLARTGFLRTEYQPDESRIHYIYNLGDRVLTRIVLEGQKGLTFEDLLRSVLVMGQPAPPPRPDTRGQPQLRLGPRGFART